MKEEEGMPCDPSRETQARTQDDDGTSANGGHGDQTQKEKRHLERVAARWVCSWKERGGEGWERGRER